MRRIGEAFCLLLAVYLLAANAQLFAFAGLFIPLQIHAAISLSGALVALFLVPGMAEAAKRGAFGWAVAGVLTAAALAGLGAVIFDYDRILMYSMFGSLDTTGVILALCIVVPLIEAVRRKAGIVLPLIILALVGVVVFQQWMPGILYGRGYPIDRLLYSAYVGGNGIFGLPLRVAADVIIVFVIFGALITASGAGAWFLDVALILTGRRPGGPAKAAVVASALFGSVSGSPSANAASTGVFTIPLMTRIGYKPSFAAAVEAVASTSGQILPPVMGAIAFVMAEWTGNSYATIVQAALVPAILYILILYASVHFQARRANIPVLASDEIPDLKATLKRGWYYPLPLVLLCWLLFFEHYPPSMAAVLTLPLVVAVSFLGPDRANWLTPPRIAGALVSAIHAWKGIAVITAAVGIMVGAMDLSGVGLKFADFIIQLSGGNLIVTLALVGLAALILGMGLDSIPAYVTLATLLAPALIALGVSEIGAHFFVVYWGLASFFTPPMCIAVFVTTSISGSSIWDTGLEAVKLGLGAFLVPFAFVLEPALLMQGDLPTLVSSTATALVGSVALAAAMRGYCFTPLSAWRRCLGGLGGIAMIYPDLIVSLGGLVLAALAFFTVRGISVAALKRA